VYLWWTVWSSRAPSVTVRITHAAGTATRTINQTTGGGQWNSLGTYELLASARVTIVAASGGYSTCADAARIRPVSAPVSPPPAGGSEIIIDDGAAGTSSVGSWSPSSAPSPHGTRSLYARDSGTYTFQRAISTPATYDVYAWWTEWSSRDPAVPSETQGPADGGRPVEPARALHVLDHAAGDDPRVRGEYVLRRCGALRARRDRAAASR
jgi:hypothetical protein